MKYSHQQLDEMMQNTILINHSIDIYGAPCRRIKTGTGYEIRIFEKTSSPKFAVFNPDGTQESAHQTSQKHLECALFFIQEHLQTRK